MVLYILTVVVLLDFQFWSMVWKVTETVTMIICWLVSWEILAWSIVLSIRTVKLRAEMMVREIARDFLNIC